jgi:hypothetical protein
MNLDLGSSLKLVSDYIAEETVPAIILAAGVTVRFGTAA